MVKRVAKNLLTRKTAQELIERAKTGTLTDISSIAGFLTTKKGQNLVFCIINNDVNLSNSDKKMLEDYIIREAYLRL